MRPHVLISFVFVTLVSATAMAIPVDVTTNEWDTSWWWGPAGGPLTREFSDATIDLPEGDFVIRVGWESGFTGHVDAFGNVTILAPSGVGAVGGQNSVEFLPVPISVDTNNYETNYSAPGVGRTNGDSTIWVVPGTSGNYSIGLDHDTPGSSLRFSVDAVGQVIPVNDFRGDYSVSIDGGPSQLTFKTTPVRIDPGAHDGPLRFIYDTSWYGARDMHMVKGTAMSLGLNNDRVRFEIAADGTLISMNEVAATVTGTTLKLNNTVVTIDPALYDSTYVLYRPESAPPTTGGPRDYVLVPGLRWSIRLFLNPFHYFHVEADGTVSGTDTDTFDYDGSTLRIRTVPVTVDPGNFQYAWTPIFYSPDYPSPARHPFIEGPATFNLPPDTSWPLRIYGTSGSFTIEIDSAGDVASVEPDIAVISGNILEFRTVRVAIDPGPYELLWQFLGGPNGWLYWEGPQTFDLVPGFDYRIWNSAGGTPQYVSVFEPCAVVPSTLTFANSSYTISCDVAPPDADEDGVPDDADNCPDTANSDQVDLDGDGLGDVCDDDLDDDGLPNAADNCPEIPNPSQADTDGDGAGDLCDADIDGDSVPDDADNCVFVANTDQADNDADGTGDLCDSDDDNDGADDLSDNCPLVPNSAQTDGDGDGLGDACDADSDGDGIANEDDQCAESSAGLPVDSNGCNGGQFIDLACDPDAFANHGRYVSCVAKAAKQAVDLGLIAPNEKSRFVRDAARK